ncbi:glycine--tRNA ligase [Blattabacterium cuenoti]|uniref:glycine--tRNA ligase n=1 Tax=Blattabacterium cuenoti TaxID=1653831 RepID=UPI00163D35DE|nr:glycine--tRNA ligase [Blattabacterium cuenoti]
MKNFLKFLISHSKSYGFIFPSNEIYGGINAIYDYGQYGIELKNNIKEFWWKSMTQLNENIVGIDSSILTHSNVLKSSGHIDEFKELLVYNKNSKKKYQVHLLIENHIKKFFKNDNEQINKILIRLNEYFKKKDTLNIINLINELNIHDPISGNKKDKIWTNIHFMNMMFEIKNSKNLFLRPETAQGIFCNFINVQKSSRMKIPFGIAQIGKSFRNEIIARQFLFRLREFEQMEMQFFINPKEEKKWYKYWKNIRLKWHNSLNLGKNKYRLIDHKNLAHYASLGVDIEFNYPFGFRELEGIHSRRDFDLKKHELFTNKKFIINNNKKVKYTPYVIETSLGLDRLFMAILSSSLKEEKLDNGKKRTILKIPPCLSPVKAAILPLVKKDGIPDIANKIFHNEKINHNIIYDYKDSIGKLYRRQDAIGTPLCFTVDYKTIENNTVTIRYRDNMNQERIHINEISNKIELETGLKNILKKLLNN